MEGEEEKETTAAASAAAALNHPLQESVSREKKLSFRAVIFSLKVSHTSTVSTAHHNVRHVYSKDSLLMSNVEM